MANPVPAETAVAATPVPVETRSDAAFAEDDGTIVLSPFEVNTSKDRGFAAVNAGTATKLGLDLKDLAAPYSVMTGEFIKTLGITDTRAAVFWSTGGSQVFDGQGSDPFGLNGANTVTTSTMYSIRGVTINAGQQRNFFLNANIGDNYNVDRIDFGRGPNAVLFNVGANSVLGGGISTQGKRAQLHRDFTDVGMKAGSWDNYRATIDYNRRLTDDLAVRVNLMGQKTGSGASVGQNYGWADDAWEDRQGVTLAATYRLTAKTELRVEGIYDVTKRSTAPFPYFDVLSGWDGKTYFNGPLSDQIMNGNAPIASGGTLQTRPGSYQAGSREGINRYTTPTYIWDPVTNTVSNWIHMATTRRGDENEWVPFYLGNTVFDRAGNTFILPFGNSNAQGAGNRDPDPTQNGGQAAFQDMINLPANRFDRQVANSHFTVPGQRFSAMPNMPLFSQRFNDVNFALTHSFSDDLFLEVAGDWNRQWEGASNGHLNLRFGMIDLNQSLPNGQPNPNFKKAYSQTNNGMQWNYRTLTNWGLRTNLGYIKDLGKWGHYTFNASAAQTSRTAFSTQKGYSAKITTALPAEFNHPAGVADPRQWHAGNNRIETRYYWDGSPRVDYGTLQPTSLFQRVPTTTAGVTTYATSTSPLSPGWVLTDWAWREERTTTGVFAFAARYFDNKLIISPGIRMDRHTAYIRNRWGNWGMFPDNPNWDGLDISSNGYWKPDAPADWKTYIPGDRPTIGGANDVNRPNPAANDKRYRGDFNNPKAYQDLLSKTAGVTYHLFPWVALKASYGESFLPGTVARFDLTGADVDPEVGKAYEGAVTFSLWQNRLAITPRYYHNLQTNRLGMPTQTPINDLMSRRAWDDPNSSGRNPYNYNVVLGSDFFETENDGVELEVVGEITRGWRIMANYGTAQASDLPGRFPAVQAYTIGRADEFRQVLEAAGGMLDTSRKPDNGGHLIDDAPGVAIPNPAITDALMRERGGDPTVRQNAVTNYNQIWVAYDNHLQTKDTKTVANKYKRANLFTNYTFQSGTLKGFMVGAGVNYSDQVKAGSYHGQSIANPDYNPAIPVSNTNRQWIDDPDVGINDPVWAKRPIDYTLTFGYDGKLPERWGWVSGKHINVQLTVRNPFNEKDTFYQDDGVVNRPPGGDPSLGYRETVVNRVAQYRLPISFELQATVSF